MYRLVYLLVYLFLKTCPDLDLYRFPDLISGSGSLRQRFSRKNTRKIIGDVPVHTGIRSRQAGGQKYFFFHCAQASCSVASPDRLFSLTQSFFGAERRWRSLYQHKGPSGHNARQTVNQSFIETCKILSECIFFCEVLHMITQRHVCATL